MLIMDLQLEEISKGNNLTLEMLANEKLLEKLHRITVNFNNTEIRGEYKGFDYTIDKDLNAKTHRYFIIEFKKLI